MSELDGSAFDFWLGEWDCTFEGGTATNSITRDFDGHVVTERFEVQTPKRMVFSNITPDAFDWRWESSPDGDTWTENWAIAYRRKA